MKKLSSDEKRSIAVLSVGSFLEYFDLMLYIHMAVLLNDLFFSQRDNFSSQLLTAFSFSVTFVCRPIGAYFIGRLGDKVGRKATVMITSFSMAVTCIIMATLPTYAQIGVTASWMVTICRIVQGISSMGETVGADIYLTELIKPPLVYPAVAFTNVACFLGTMSALFVAKLSLSEGYSWRYAFWFGTIVALIGIFTRVGLAETRDYSNAKKRIKDLLEMSGFSEESLSRKPWDDEKLQVKLSFALFCVQLACPVFHLYFTYIHGSNILKNSFNYTPAQVIEHNFIISIFDLSSVILMTYLVYFINPLKILKVKYFITAPFFLIVPFFLNNVSNVFELTLIQLFVVFFMPSEFPATPILCKAFPIFQRFSVFCIIFAISRALIYVISSFGVIYLIKYFGNWGLLFLFVPVLVGYGWGLSEFIKKYNEPEENSYEEELDEEFTEEELQELIFNRKKTP